MVKKTKILDRKAIFVSNHFPSLNCGISLVVRGDINLVPVEPALPLHNLLTFEFCSGEDTPFLPAETSLVINSTNMFTNMLNSPLTMPLSFDQSISSSFPENFSHAVDNAGLFHYNGGRYHCPECTIDFKLEKDFRRHLKTVKPHQLTAFQCCCTYKSGRKDNFLKHITRKNICSPIASFICSCGYRVESNSPDAIARLLRHIKPCGQRKRGRPRK